MSLIAAAHTYFDPWFVLQQGVALLEIVYCDWLAFTTAVRFLVGNLFLTNFKFLRRWL